MNLFYTNNNYQRSSIKPIVHKFILSESNKSLRTGWNEKHTWNADIGDCVQNFDKAYCKNVTDFVRTIQRNQEFDHGGYVNSNCPGVGRGCIVPALNLKTTVAESGSGTETDPYILFTGEEAQDDWKDYKDEKSINSSNKAWTIKFNKPLDTSIINSDNIRMKFNVKS